MTGQHQDPEQVIRDWLADTAPDRTPASLRQTLDVVTMQPAGNAGPGSRGGSLRLRFAGGVAAIAILAVVASGAYLSARVKPGAETSGGIPSTGALAPNSGWQVTSIPFTGPAQPDSVNATDPAIFALPGHGFVAFQTPPPVVVGAPAPIDLTEVQVFQSADGVTWNEKSSFPGKACVTSLIESGDLIVAVGWIGDISLNTAVPMVWTTTDLHSWHPVGLPTLGGYLPWAVAAGPSGFLALGSDSKPGDPVRFWSSPDGLNWALVPGSGPAGFETADLFGVPGGYALHSHDNNQDHIWWSANGSAWTKTWVDDAPAGTFRYPSDRPLKSTTGGYVWFGGGYGNQSETNPGLTDVTVWTGPDMTHWTTSASVKAPGYINGYAAISGGYLAAGAQPGPGSDGRLAVWTSVDGRAWQPAAGLPLVPTNGYVRVIGDGVHVVIYCKSPTGEVSVVVGPTRLVETRPASNSPTAKQLVGDWHMANTQWIDAQPGAFSGSTVTRVVGLSSGGFVAFVFNAELDQTAVFHSSDGTAWGQVGLLQTKHATVTGVTDWGGRVIAVGYAYDQVANRATPMAWSSTDLATWHAAVLPAPTNTGAMMIAGGSAGFAAWGMELTQRTGLHWTYWISVDGASWHAVTGPNLQANGWPEDLSANSSGFVMRTNDSGRIQTWRLVDGSTWTEAWNRPADSGPDRYQMGRPVLKAADGSYVTFGSVAIGASDGGPVMWTSGDLVSWTMAGRLTPSSAAISTYASIPGGFLGTGWSDPVLPGSRDGSVGVWTSVDGRTWQQMPGISTITGVDSLMLPLGVASDGIHVIVVLRDDHDGIHLLVGTELK